MPAVVLTDAQGGSGLIYRPWDGEGGYAARRPAAVWGMCLQSAQAHTSQSGWNPEDAPSLWAQVLIPDPAVIPTWQQPDSTNPYMTGDKVTHGGKTWRSTCDNNVWEPGVYGWEEVTT